jgi:hypothetical protein
LHALLQPEDLVLPLLSVDIQLVQPACSITQQHHRCVSVELQKDYISAAAGTSLKPAHSPSLLQESQKIPTSVLATTGMLCCESSHHQVLGTGCSMKCHVEGARAAAATTSPQHSFNTASTARLSLADKLAKLQNPSKPTHINVPSNPPHSAAG